MIAFASKMFFSFTMSLLVTGYLVPFFAQLARKLKFVDVPDGSLKRHEAPVPYMGGLAVFVGLLCGLALTVPLNSDLSLLLIGTTLLLLVGLIDDLFPLKAYQKFGGQLVAAFCFVKSGFYLKEHVFYNMLNIPLSFFWMLTIINAFNLVDVMDGLSSTIALGAIVPFIVIAVLLKHYTVALALAALAGGLCAFLRYNWPPAIMYLGDAGSLFVGGFLATIPFLFNWGTYTPYGYLAPVIILSIPLLEITALVLIRTRKGIPFYLGSPDHFACYFMQAGWSKPSILFYVMGVSVLLGSVALCLTFNLMPLPVLALGYGVILAGWVYILVRARLHRAH